MGAGKYPLEPLAQLKKERAEAATRQLGKVIGARQEAERRRAEAEAAREQAEARAARVREDERVSLEAGELAAKDLHRREAWESRVRAEAADRARAVDEARAMVLARRRQELEAQAEVARARGDVEAVRRHEARWTSAQRRAREAEEEEAALEASRPKPLR